MAHQSREVRLASKPKGLPSLENFELAVVSLPDPKPGQVLVRNRRFRVAASIRMMISQGAHAVEGVPFPALNVGDTLTEEAVGEVISVPRGSPLAVGDLVKHSLGWRELALVSVERCRKLDPGFANPAIVLGHGSTAYAALTRAAVVKPGATVFVSSAAGAIGSMAGQIARCLGATRVIGSVGTHDKGRRLVSELRYDAYVCREAGPIAEQLAEAAADGIDLTLDLVGGDQLSAAVSCARSHGCVLVLGALSGQLAVVGTGRAAPVQLDSFALLVKKLTVRGYSADDHPEAEPEWELRASEWGARGMVVFPTSVVRGLENAPSALLDLIHGGHFGVLQIEI